MLVWLWLAVLFICCLADRNPYRILGVKQNATQRQIKKSFRNLSKQWHPDRKKPEEKDQAERKFSDIAWAYEVLTNDTLRKIYDEEGENGIKRAQQGAPTPRHPFEQFFRSQTGAGWRFTGAGFPGGGFPGGGFPGGGAFPGGGGFPGGGHQQPRPLQRVEWFKDTEIEYVQDRVASEDMDEHWPDLFFFFSNTGPQTKKVADLLISLSEEYSNLVEIQALDCRRPHPDCEGQRKHPNLPYELQLVSALHFKDKRQKRPVKVTVKSLEELREWINAQLPGGPTSLLTVRAFESFFTLNTTRPKVLAVTSAPQWPLPMRKLMQTNRGRVDFVGINKSTRGGKNLWTAILERVSGRAVEGGESSGSGARRVTVESKFARRLDRLESGYLLIADSEVLNERTVDTLSASESSLAQDLTFMKWRSNAKTRMGVYQEAMRSVRELTAESVSRQGVCGPQDRSLCLILMKKGIFEGVDLSAFGSLAAAASIENMRILYLDLENAGAHDPEPPFPNLPPQIMQVLKELSVEEMERGLVVAYRPRRHKLIKFTGTLDTAFTKFLDNVRDGVAFIQAPKQEL